MPAWPANHTSPAMLPISPCFLTGRSATTQRKTSSSATRKPTAFALKPCGTCCLQWMFFVQLAGPLNFLVGLLVQFPGTLFSEDLGLSFQFFGLLLRFFLRFPLQISGALFRFELGSSRQFFGVLLHLLASFQLQLPGALL